MKKDKLITSINDMVKFKKSIYLIIDQKKFDVPLENYFNAIK